MERKLFLRFISEIILKILIQLNARLVRPENTCRMKVMAVVTIQVAYQVHGSVHHKSVLTL